MRSHLQKLYSAWAFPKELKYHLAPSLKHLETESVIKQK